MFEDNNVDLFTRRRNMYKILKAEKLADKIYLMNVHAPRVASHCQPGQFVIVKMDEKGELLIGVSISVKEVPSMGAITDIDGRFKIGGIKAGHTLVISYVGYDPQEIKMKKRFHLVIPGYSRVWKLSILFFVFIRQGGVTVPIQ